MCEICKIPGCHPRCPNYSKKSTALSCSICNEGIIDGDKYVENTDGECVHYDCLNDNKLSDAIEWLGGEIHIMEDL